jgi:hypothetical protein
LLWYGRIAKDHLCHLGKVASDGEIPSIQCWRSSRLPEAAKVECQDRGVQCVRGAVSSAVAAYASRATLDVSSPSMGSQVLCHRMSLMRASR